MNIQEMSRKFKHFFENPELFTTVLLILVACTSFVLGRMSVEAERSPADRSQSARSEAAVTLTQTARPEKTIYVGSVNSDKYHLPWCSGAQRINDENKIVFNTKEEAREAGYEPAGNCKGI